jgi:hypothetical protein
MLPPTAHVLSGEFAVVLVPVEAKVHWPGVGHPLRAVETRLALRGGMLPPAAHVLNEEFAVVLVPAEAKVHWPGVEHPLRATEGWNNR